MATVHTKMSEQHAPYLGIGNNPARKPQAPYLTGELVISGDNHIALGGADFFYENAPSRLKNRVPRIFFDEKKKFWDMRLHGTSLWPFGTDDLIFAMTSRRGAWDVDAHVSDMEAEGVTKSIAFPNQLPGLFKNKDYDMREYVMYEYNKYLSRFQQRQPGRFYGIGIPNFWAPEAAAGWIKEMKNDGIRVAMLPLHPGTYSDGSEIFYGDDRFNPMWEALVDNNMGAAFHIGENFGLSGRGGFEAAAVGSLGGLEFRHVWSRLTFGGVFDRFPKLRVFFAEANIHWVPGMLNDADQQTNSMGAIFKDKPKRRPSDYWYTNCYAGFMYDIAGLRLIDMVGVENAIWSADYSHNEGTYGYTGDCIKAIVDLTGKENAKKIYGTNALRFIGEA
jgi:predicted TIM-barrel fold metal-dependent hydrolase